MKTAGDTLPTGTMLGQYKLVEPAYPWNNQDELQLLRNIQATLEQEFKPYQQNFLLVPHRPMHLISTYVSDKVLGIQPQVPAL